MNKLLLIDTSRDFILLGLISDDTTVFKQVKTDRNISVYLMNSIIEFLDENGVDKTDLSGICTGGGPGTFTGIRLSITIAKIFAYSLGIKLFAISSLQLYTLFVKERNVISIDDARSYKYYYGILNKDTLEYTENIDFDDKVVDLCDLRDDYLKISTREFINITTQIVDNFDEFDLETFKKLVVKADVYNYKPEYIKQLD